jgi:excisionase family DNA binding protein
MDSDKLMTTDDVADYLQTNRKYVYRLIHSGLLDCYRIGIRDIRISMEQVKAFLERNSGGQK